MSVNHCWDFIRGNFLTLILIGLIVSVLFEAVTLLHLFFLESKPFLDPYVYLTIIRSGWLMFFICFILWFSRRLVISIDMKRKPLNFNTPPEHFGTIEQTTVNDTRDNELRE